jgi:spermidine synthase
MLLLASFLSGAAGLVFELLWANRLGLLFGSAAAAQAAVLAAFLGGLAIGSRLLGSAADAAPSPLRFYARLEWAVALFGLAGPLLLGAAEQVRLLAPAAVLFHAFLMGGAIPALCRAAGGDAQRSVGRLYAANAAGAAVGVLGAAFAAIPLLGLSYAGFACGAALNVLAGWAALRAEGRPLPADPPAPRRDASPASELPLGLVLGAAFVSGAAALVYETAWTRMLALVLGSSTYSFAEMLAALIGGLAVGGALAASAWARRRDSGTLLGLSCLGAGLAVLASLPAAPLLPWVFSRLRADLPELTFYGYELMKFAFCALVLLVPAAALGAVPALAARHTERDQAGRGGRVGELLASNALGNALGAAAWLWLLPRFGA